MRTSYVEPHTYPGSRTLAGLALGLGFYLFCRGSIPDGGHEFMDSPLYPWGWVLLSAVAWALGRGHGEWGPTWGVVLLFPQLLAVVVEGRLVSLDGAVNLGVRNVYLVLLNAVVVAGAGTLGQMMARRAARAHPRHAHYG